jgi:hypothetical protein
MKSQPPTSPLETPAPGDTQLIDLDDVELSAADGVSASADSSRAAPPPLPPEALAPPRSSVGAVVRASASVAPPARSTGFFLGAILVCLVIGVGGGIAVAMSSLRKAPASAPASASSAASSGKAAPGVITIPTVTVDDEPSSGR